MIAETLDGSVLANLDERTQVAILGYGENTGTGKLGTLKSARGKLTSLGNDGSAGEPALLDTLDRALSSCSRSARTEPEGVRCAR